MAVERKEQVTCCQDVKEDEDLATWRPLVTLAKQFQSNGGAENVLALVNIENSFEEFIIKKSR